MSARKWALALALAAALAGPAAATAASCPKTSVADIEDEVMCPVCGTSLAVATEAPQARRERAFILRLVERCDSKEQIKSALAAEFGPRVLALPRKNGFDLAAYLVPILALLAGMAVVLTLVRRARSDGRAGSVPPPFSERSESQAGESTLPVRSGDRERLDADLRKYDL